MLCIGVRQCGQGAPLRPPPRRKPKTDQSLAPELCAATFSKHEWQAVCPQGTAAASCGISMQMLHCVPRWVEGAGCGACRSNSNIPGSSLIAFINIVYSSLESSGSN